MIRMPVCMVWGLTAVLAVGAIVPPTASAEQWRDEHVRAVGQLRREVLRVDNSPHDPAAVVAFVGRDPKRLAETVSEWISWQPELGVVRGAGGTLSAGAGGDWDRAVLLRAVLASAGYPSRFVVAERSAEARRAAVDSYLAADATVLTAAVRPGEPIDESADTELLERFGVPVRNRTVRMAEAAARWRRLLDEAYDSGERHADHLVRRLATPDRGPVANFDFPKWRQGLLSAAAEAVAVEVQTHDGWKLLALGPAADGIDWSAARRVSDVPEDRVATFTLRLEMALAGEGAPEAEVVLLEHKEELGPLFRRPMRLEIAAAGDEAEAGAGSWDADELYDRISAFERFQAVLQVGSEWHASQAFDMSGRVFTIGRDGRIEGTEQLGEALHGVLGGLFGAPAEEPDEPATRLETITLVIEIDRPGLPVVSQRRLLYGPIRPGVTPAFHADILAAGGPISPASVNWLALDALTANAEFWADTVSAADPGQYADDAPVRMPQILYEWHLARLGLADRQLIRDDGLTLIAAPAVSMWTTQIVLDDENRSATARTTLDVVWDAMHIGPRRQEHAQAAARANVSLGVASTCFEALLLRELTPPATIRTALAEVELFLPDESPPGEPSALADWAIRHNETDRSVLLAGRETPESWWSMDPITCATIGRGDGGEGQAAAEYLKLSASVHKQNLRNLKCFMQAIGGGSGGGYVFCMTGVDGVGGAMGAVGSVTKWTGRATGVGGLFGSAADALSVINAMRSARGDR